jgi:hypothetical protein
MTTKTRYITFMPSARSRARNMLWLLAVAVFGLLVALTAPSARAEFGICIQAGDADNFVSGGPADVVVLQPAFAAWLNTPVNQQFCAPAATLPFDTVRDNCSFGYSFKLPFNPCCPAELTIHLKAGPSIPSTDGLSLGRAPGFAWGLSLNVLDGMPLCSAGTPVNCCTHVGPNVTPGTWSAGEEMICVLDLCNLPPDADGTTNVMPDMQSVGGLDVYVQDDTGVGDIDLCIDKCRIVPAVSEWGLGALTLLLLSGVAFKFSRRRAAA